MSRELFWTPLNPALTNDLFYNACTDRECNNAALSGGMYGVPATTLVLFPRGSTVQGA